MSGLSRNSIAIFQGAVHAADTGSGREDSTDDGGKKRFRIRGKYLVKILAINCCYVRCVLRRNIIDLGTGYTVSLLGATVMPVPKLMRYICKTG